MLLDNARIHCYPQLFEAAAAFGVVVVFLPPYSPHINPIEFQFSLLKRYIQKHARKLWDIDADLVLDVAMRDLSSTLIDTFKHCGFDYESLNFRINELED